MADDAATRRPARVLVADSNPVSRRILETALRHRGHACEVADNGDQACALYEAFRPDVLIVDWAIPGVNGRDLCRRIRAAPDGRRCYVMVTAALGRYAHVLAAMRAGADDYLTRPLHEDQLESRLIAARRVVDMRTRLAATEVGIGRRAGGRFRAARRDPVTGLGNQQALLEHLAAIDARTQRYGHPYCIGLCAFDGGRPEGAPVRDSAANRFVSAAARAIRDECHGADLAYRRGTEVVVVMPDRTLPRACHSLERMRSAVENLGLRDHDGRSGGVVTISAGLAAREGTPGESTREVLARAAAALHDARGRGGNAVVARTWSVAPQAEAERAEQAIRPRRFAPAHDPYLDRVVGALRETRRKGRGARRFPKDPHRIEGAPRDGGS